MKINQDLLFDMYKEYCKQNNLNKNKASVLHNFIYQLKQHQIRLQFIK